jgi:hypothetical protein
VEGDAMSTERRNLIISPVGEGSVHASWLSEKELRSFDVFLVNYSQLPDYGRAEADHYLSRRGFKWELIAHLAGMHRDVLERYDRIWCPDGDIRASTSTINRLFEVAEQFGLQLAQPAIASGEVSYRVLRPEPGAVLRYTPLVEIMCPLFSRQAFFQVLPTFRESRSGWGLDLLWPRRFAACQVAIVDAAGVEHTGQLFRGENYRNLKALGVDPGEEFDRIVARYGGFDRRLHRKLVRGRIKLPAARESRPRRRSLAARLLDALGLREARA